MQTKTPEYNERAMSYYYAHREECLERRKQRRLEHREEEREKARARYRQNCEKIKADVRAWNKAHPEVAKAYREANKERIKIRQRNDALKRFYGITQGEYNAIHERQDGKCAICGGPPNGQGNKFHVDHDHKTGKVRGLLCNRCNLILGHAKDRRDVLQSAIIYLINTKEV